MTGDGGPAFPTVPVMSAHGMSLRDYFAGQALTGAMVMQIEAAKIESPSNENIVSTLAEITYEIADAMLAAREAKGEAS